MEISRLKEARREPSKNVKQNTRDRIMAYDGKEGYHITFSSVEKIGKNPRAKRENDTPTAIYAYPTKYLTYYKDIGRVEFPFAYSRPYIYVLKSKGNILHVEDYIITDFYRDLKKLYKGFDSIKIRSPKSALKSRIIYKLIDKILISIEGGDFDEEGNLNFQLSIMLDSLLAGLNNFKHNIFDLSDKDYSVVEEEISKTFRRDEDVPVHEKDIEDKINSILEKNDLKEDFDKICLFIKNCFINITTYEHSKIKSATDKKNFYATSIYNITKTLANKMPNRWNKILSKILDYDVIIDPGYKVIHSFEPAQTIFLTTKGYTVVETILNTEWTNSKKRFMLDSRIKDILTDSMFRLLDKLELEGGEAISRSEYDQIKSGAKAISLTAQSGMSGQSIISKKSYRLLRQFILRIKVNKREVDKLDSKYSTIYPSVLQLIKGLEDLINMSSIVTTA